MDPDAVTRVTLALALALALAVLGAHPRVREWENRLGAPVLVAVGLPFLALGAIFASPRVGVLNAKVLEDLRPALDFGLGWMGFALGSRLDARRLEALPRALMTLLVAQTVVPMVLTALVCGAALTALRVGVADGLVRNVLLLCGCAAASAPVVASRFRRRHGGQAGEIVEEAAALDAIVSLATLGAVSVYLRPDASLTSWTLPPSAWLLLLAGLGAVLGLLAFFTVRGARTETEEVLLILGTVAISAGAAGYLALSGPVVCAIAGAVLANLPMDDRPGFRRLLGMVERPLYLVFLVIVGASWRVDEPEAWALALAFAGARVLGKLAASIVAAQAEPTLPRWRELAAISIPQGPVAIAVIVGAASLHGDGAPAAIRWATHAVIVGAFMSEAVARGLRRIPVPRGSG